MAEEKKDEAEVGLGGQGRDGWRKEAEANLTSQRATRMDAAAGFD